MAEGERSRRVAEQRAHAEQALRQDLARRLADTVREAERVRQAMGDLAAAEDRIRALEEDAGRDPAPQRRGRAGRRRGHRRPGACRA